VVPEAVSEKLMSRDPLFKGSEFHEKLRAANLNRNVGATFIGQMHGSAELLFNSKYRYQF
jgi:hypothetical protein